MSSGLSRSARNCHGTAAKEKDVMRGCSQPMAPNQSVPWSVLPLQGEKLPCEA